MGFIKGNINSLEVFLTDYGLQTFYRDGLKEEALLFSVMDDDANYNQFDSTFYDPINIFNNPDNVIPTITLGAGTPIEVWTTGTTTTGWTETVVITGTTFETTGATPPSGGGGTPGTAVKINNVQWNNGGGVIFAEGYTTGGTGTIQATLQIPHLWINGDSMWSSSTRNLVDSRMNEAGIWVDGGAPDGEFVGFARAINVASARTVYIGMSADNKFKFTLNGTTLVENEDSVLGGPNFNYWNVYPVDLLPGTNLIEMLAANNESAAGMAAEIYDCTFNQLTGVTTEAGLDAFILFSTRDIVGEPFDVGDTIGWSCPPGWALDTSGAGDPVCRRLIATTGTTEIFVTGTTVTGGTITIKTGRFVNGQHHVYTLPNKRGSVLDGVEYKRPILKTNEDTFKNYVAFEGDLTTEQDFSLLTYRKINGVKQFNLNGVNGLYLKYNDSGVTIDNRIYDLDAYPQTATDYDFSYINAKFNNVAGFKYFSGSNDSKKINKTVSYSQIIRTGYLILNELYDIDFDMQFSFYSPDYETISADNREIKINVFAILGKNKIPMDIYTPGSDPELAPTSGNTSALWANDGTSIEYIPQSLVEIVDDHKTLHIKDVLTQSVSGTTIGRDGTIRCRLKRGMCKKSKELVLHIDFNGRYGGNTLITQITDVLDEPPVAGGGGSGGGTSGGSTGGGTWGGGYGGGGGGCLMPGTKITLIDGSSLNVEKVKKGMFLASQSIQGLNAGREDKEYLDNWSVDELVLGDANTVVKAIKRVTVDGMYVFNNRLQTSPSHIHFVYDGSKYVFKTADKIKMGEYLITPGGMKEKIYLIRTVPGKFTMYLVDTEIHDTFIAEGYITHNKMAPDDGDLA